MAAALFARASEVRARDTTDAGARAEPRRSRARGTTASPGARRYDRRRARRARDALVRRRRRRDDRHASVAAAIASRRSRPSCVRDGVVDDRVRFAGQSRALDSAVDHALTNITWEMVKDAPRSATSASSSLGVLEGHVFVAHNAGFDWRFVSAEVERATRRPLRGGGSARCGWRDACCRSCAAAISTRVAQLLRHRDPRAAPRRRRRASPRRTCSCACSTPRAIAAARRSTTSIACSAAARRAEAPRRPPAMPHSATRTPRHEPPQPLVEIAPARPLAHSRDPGRRPEARRRRDVRRRAEDALGAPHSGRRAQSHSARHALPADRARRSGPC